ncbi:MAG: TIGR04086 family membrane protein [Clostridia bacterium]|nr:TIGR04086 family membrane protein [Clostridia bacterium]
MKSKKSSKQSARKKSSSQNYSIASASIFGACAGAFLTVISVIICSVICLFSENPDKLISPLAFTSVIIIYFFSGFLASKKKSAAIPCGLLCGVILTLIFFIISLFITETYSSGSSLIVGLLIRISFVAVSIIGALLGTNTANKKRRR